MNKFTKIFIPRYLGPRNNEYTLTVYTDASKCNLGCAVYISETGLRNTSLVLARTSMVKKSMRNKAIPLLKLEGKSYSPLSSTMKMDPKQNIKVLSEFFLGMIYF